MKTCKDCDQEKPLDQFYKGQGDCKVCFRARVKKNRLANVEHYRRYDKDRQKYNPERVFRHRYSQMKLRVEGRATRKYPVEGKELCTLQEFVDWCYAHKSEYDALFQEWARHDFDRPHTPSIDRIDNTRGYALDNLQWLSQRDNGAKDAKGRTGIRNKKGQYECEKILQRL